jgi:hypothetical protein
VRCACALTPPQGAESGRLGGVAGALSLLLPRCAPARPPARPAAGSQHREGAPAGSHPSSTYPWPTVAHGARLRVLPVTAVCLGWRRAHCLRHCSSGDGIPSSAITGQREAEGELRYVLVERVSQYGCDLQLRQEARTLGIWGGTALTFSLNASELTLVPCVESHTGNALCLHHVVDGGAASGPVALEDVLTVAQDGGGLRVRRRYCSGSHTIAETCRHYRYTEARASVIAAADFRRQQQRRRWQLQHQPRVMSRLEEGRAIEAQVTSYHEVGGHIYYSCTVSWAAAQLGSTDAGGGGGGGAAPPPAAGSAAIPPTGADEEVVSRQISKRYSEFVSGSAVAMIYDAWIRPAVPQPPLPMPSPPPPPPPPPPPLLTAQPAVGTWPSVTASRLRAGSSAVSLAR